jgi:hypothetical protein
MENLVIIQQWDMLHIAIITTRNFVFCNYHLQLKFSCMQQMQPQIHVVA